MCNAYARRGPPIRTVFINKKMDLPPYRRGQRFVPQGILFGVRQLDKLTDIMKREQVDMELLLGDLMDDTVDAYFKRKHETAFAEADCTDGRFTPLWAIMYWFR